MCINTNQPDTKSNPNPTTKQHAVVSIQLNMDTRTTYPEKVTWEWQRTVFTTFGCHCHSPPVQQAQHYLRPIANGWTHRDEEREIWTEECWPKRIAPAETDASMQSGIVRTVNRKHANTSNWDTKNSSFHVPSAHDNTKQPFNLENMTESISKLTRNLYVHCSLITTTHTLCQQAL